MKVACHLRAGTNTTNIRSESLCKGLKALGHELVYRPRDSLSNADLVVQTGFNATTAILDAIERGVPYLIMEAPPFRTLCPVETWSSFGYNGLAGGAYRPEPLDDVRPSPTLHEERTTGSTLIIGQNPTDHSLRGSDHVGWLEEKARQYPEASIRHHPLMVVSQDTIEEALEDVHRLVAYCSTAAVDGGIRGCDVRVEGQGCWWDPSEDREKQVHRLSWAAYTHKELETPEVAEYILSGYDKACEHTQEIPRGKVNGRAIQREYHKRLVR